jgi:hypothetical protein
MVLHVPAGEGRVGEGRGANSSPGASAFPPAIDPNLLNLEIYRAVEAANKEWKPVTNQDSWDSVDSDRQLALRLQTEEVAQLSMCPHMAIYVSSCCYICVLISCYIHVSVYGIWRCGSRRRSSVTTGSRHSLYKRLHNTKYVTSYYYICPHTAMYVSSYCHISVLRSFTTACRSLR